MTEVGKKIAELRKNSNMTQLELADMLGISFQAVSNWERGNSMPDISKLPEIAELFQVSIDEILGKHNSVLHDIVNGEQVRLANHSETDIDEVAILMKPQQVKEMIDVSDFHPRVIYALLPFLDSEAIEALMVRCKESGKSIAVFLPFLSGDRIEELVENANVKGEPVDIYLPFMSEERIREFADEAFDRGGLKEASQYFPFMAEKDLRILTEKASVHD